MFRRRPHAKGHLLLRHDGLLGQGVGGGVKADTFDEMAKWVDVSRFPALLFPPKVSDVATRLLTSVQVIDEGRAIGPARHLDRRRRKVEVRPQKRAQCPRGTDTVRRRVRERGTPP